jgi:hypothetical protein
LLLLPFGWLVLWRSSNRAASSKLKAQNSKLALFTLAFVLAILPQIVVNIRDTGSPLYSQQAKNVWQAVFGDGDWGRWGEAANDISIGQVVAQDPGRFAANWWNNLRGFFGTGGEDTREFGQAVQLRLLGFPANWLAVGGLLGWLAVTFSRRRQGDGASERGGEQVAPRRPVAPSPRHPIVAASPRRHVVRSSLLAWVALYVAAVSVGLAPQSRFFLPLAPVYALAAAWLVARLQLPAETEDPQENGDQRPQSRASRIRHFVIRNTQCAIRSTPLLVSLLLALLWGGFRTGADYAVGARSPGELAVLPGQPGDEVEIIRLAQATLRANERLVVRADPSVPIGKYSAIAHLAVPAQADTPEALRASGAQYLIWSAALGRAPESGSSVGSAGIYTLYRVEQ